MSEKFRISATLFDLLSEVVVVMCTDVVPASSVHIVLHEGVGGVGIGGATDNNGVAIRNGTISGFRIGIRFLGVAGGSVDHVTFFNNTEAVTAFHHAAVRDGVFWGNTTTLDVGGPSHITGNHIIGAETAIIARCPSLILGNTIVGALVLNEAVAPCKVENNALTP